MNPQQIKDEILKLIPIGCRLATINRTWFIVGPNSTIVHDGVRCYAWAKTLQLLLDNLRRSHGR